MCSIVNFKLSLSIPSVLCIFGSGKFLIGPFFILSFSSEQPSDMFVTIITRCSDIQSYSNKQVPQLFHYCGPPGICWFQTQLRKSWSVLIDGITSNLYHKNSHCKGDNYIHCRPTRYQMTRMKKIRGWREVLPSLGWKKGVTKCYKRQRIWCSGIPGRQEGMESLGLPRKGL